MSDLSFLFDGGDQHERVARIRELRSLVAVYCGWDAPAKRALDEAVLSGASIEPALAEIDKLPALLRRRLLSSYGALIFREVL